MISGERFQFPHSIDKIIDTPIVSLQVKKTQDKLVKGIYNLSTVIQRESRARSSTAQSFRQDSLLWKIPCSSEVKGDSGILFSLFKCTK